MDRGNPQFEFSSTVVIQALSALTLIGVLISSVGAQGLPARIKAKTHSSSSGPDIILHNALVRTMDASLPIAEAVAVSGNRILAVGSNNDILALQVPGTQVFDLGGRTVVPGMIDDHGHRLQQALRDGGPEGVVRAAKELAAEGYTTVHELHGARDIVDAVRALVAENRMVVRVNFYIPYNRASGENFDEWKTFPYTEKKDTLLRIIGVKVFADGGSVGAGALTTIYQSGEAAGTHGNLYKMQEEMDSTVAEILRAGYPIAMHAIGDSAIGIGLNAFANNFVGQGNQLRSRMEHLSVMREDLANQMAALGIVASIQYTWANTTSIRLEQAYEPQVLEWCFPWRRMADRGIVIAGGNDYPYASRTQAMQSISYLATRKMQRDDVLADWLEGDQLSVEEGLRGMTTSNAWVAFEEDVKGTITPGKLADLTVLSQDPLAVDPFDVRSITIEMTMMDGIVRHDQRGIAHTAVHDAGTFRMGIDDTGLWGMVKAQVGLEYAGADHLYWGSLFVSYDSSTVAMATAQRDYGVSTNGWVQFSEPGIRAAEEATVTYEDFVVYHPGKVRISQTTRVWKDDPLLLVEYSVTNAGLQPLNGLFLGQYMDFDVLYWGTNRCGWDANDGLGFSYIFSAVDSTSPYVGMAMFDASGKSVNTSASFLRRQGLGAGEEPYLSGFMRGGIIESVSPDSSDYAMLISAGPYEIDAGSSIAPFVLAIVVGDSLDALRSAVDLARQRAIQQASVQRINDAPSGFELSQNYPNPFNPATTIRYRIPEASRVTLRVYNILGQVAAQLVDDEQMAGVHEVEWTPGSASGTYIVRIDALGTGGKRYSQSRKMLLLQ